MALAYNERDKRIYEQLASKRRADEVAKAEAAKRADARLFAEVESHLLAQRKAREEEALMTPEQRTERRLKQLEKQPGNTVPVRAQPRPRGWDLAAEDITRRWKRGAEEQRERDLDLPARRDRYDAKAREIDAALEDALTKVRDRCTEGEQAARERATTQRAALGQRPQLGQVAA